MKTVSFAGLLAAIVAVVAVAVAPAAAAPITVVDDRGLVRTFEHAPQRIVSLVPSLTEAVCGLGACDRLVGTDRSSDWPVSVRALPKLGGLDDAQVERIVALKPDVVLAGKSARVTDRLEALGLVVVAVEAQSHADVRRSLATIAALLGTPDAGARAWAAIDGDLTAAAARVPQALRGERVYFEVAAAPYAAGAASFIGETLARLGLANVVPREFGPFPRLNPEFVVRSAPDIVIASNRALASMATRPGWQGLDALKRGRTCGIDVEHYDLVVRPGPRLGEAALVLADCLAALPTVHARR